MLEFVAKPARMAMFTCMNETKTVSTRLLGKILAGTTEMIPTRPQKKRSEVAETPVEAVRTHVGLQ